MLAGKAYDFVSFASMEPDETVFVSSATESKIGIIFFKISCIIVIGKERVILFGVSTPQRPS